MIRSLQKLISSVEHQIVWRWKCKSRSRLPTTPIRVTGLLAMPAELTRTLKRVVLVNETRRSLPLFGLDRS